MKDSEAKPPAENTPRPQLEREEYRSLAQVGVQFLESGATGAGLMAGGLVVKDAYEKIKDVVTPKDEASKVELPPGADT